MNNKRRWYHDPTFNSLHLRASVELVIILGLIVTLFFGIGVGVNAALAKSCREQANAVGLGHRYSIWMGCVVKVGDTWIPFDNYRGTEQVDR